MSKEIKKNFGKSASKGRAAGKSSANKSGSGKAGANKAAGKSGSKFGAAKPSKTFDKKEHDRKIQERKLEKKKKMEAKEAAGDNNKLATFNWYPGHMTKAKRQMQEDIKLIDLVIEIVDARVPNSSRNPDIDELANNKARIVILNKADLADDKLTNAWISYFKEKGFYCLKMDSRKNNGFKELNEIILESCSEKIEKDKAKGIVGRPIRAMIVGIPNVGKSTFINAYSGKASAKTGNKPGVTKGKQWIKIKGNIELLDTPGILWPKFEDQTTGLRLAMIGSINDNILNKDDLALEVIKYLNKYYANNLKKRYEFEDSEIEEAKANYEMAINEETATSLAIMEVIALKRGCIKKGAQADFEKVSNIILDDFRSARLGLVSLERP